MQYGAYKNTRDSTWRFHLDYRLSELPIRISPIINNMGIALISYSRAAPQVLPMVREQLAHKSDGFLLRAPEGVTIFYNDACSIERQRFTACHELGHYVENHSGCLLCREPSSRDNPTEQAANVFASRLLAPACVLWGIGVQSPLEIAQICGISHASAEFRWHRLSALYAREKQWLRDYGKSCFLQSPLECAVFGQYLPFINDTRRRYNRSSISSGVV